MPIETQCPQCNLKLRVGDEFAGQIAKCPACAKNFAVPTKTDEILETQWLFKTPEGKIYGPVATSELDRWVGEGRVTDTCQLSGDRGATWISADVEYPVLGPLPVGEVRRGTPFALVGKNTASVTEQDSIRSRFLTPHRGSVVLALGLCSWMICPLLGFVAWTMGDSDLREMSEGRMDPDGEEFTKAGYFLGMIQVFAVIAAVVVGLFLFVAGYLK